jgi:hypothetical protein
MTEERLATMIEDHARFPMALYSIFQGTDLEMLRHRETDERWSPLEILAHLRDEEREDFRERARAAVEGRELALGIDPEAWVTERRYNEMDPGAVYLDWANERGESCRWLATLTLEDLEKTVEHPKFGTFAAGDFVAAWRMHDLLHLKQFARALAASWAAALPDRRVEYAGPVPGR